MNFTDFTAGKDDDDRRIDRILKQIFKNNTDVKYFEAMRKKLITVNGAKVKQDYRVHQGDIINIASFLLETKTQQANDSIKTNIVPKENSIKLNIVFENEHLKIINKPYGIPVQPAMDCSQSISHIVANEYKTQKSCSIAFVPAPLHRLDKYTTGLLCISKSMQGSRWFCEAIKTHTVKKTYIGIVQGKLSTKDLWQDKIQSTSKDLNAEQIKSFHTVQASQDGVLAVTQVMPLAYGTYNAKDISLVQFNILTGKKHQIRMQSSVHSFPLLGDVAYNGSKLFYNGKVQSFFLHAIRLQFPKQNPLNIPETIIAPLPNNFLDFMHSTLINWNSNLIL